MWGEATGKIFIHHDAPSSYAAGFTAAYSAGLKEKIGITIMPSDHIPVKSPHRSSMDFIAFDYMKQAVSWKATILKAPWKKILAMIFWNIQYSDPEGHRVVIFFMQVPTYVYNAVTKFEPLRLTTTQ